MKKNIIIAIVLALAVIGVGIIIKFSNNNSTTNTGGNKAVGYCDVVEQQYIDLEKDYPTASGIGPGEVKLTCENFESEIVNYKGVAMVDMYSPTCPHCQKMGPIVSEIAKETEGKYKIGKINIFGYQSVGTKFEVESVPAFIFFKDGKEVGRLIGEQTKEALLSKLEEFSK